MDMKAIWEAYLEVHEKTHQKSEPQAEVEEAKMYDSGWVDAKVHKDAQGNVIKTKNLAKHLAKKGAAASAPKPATVKKEEAEWLTDLATLLQTLDEKKDEHTKGATSPEGIADKESPKSKEFMDMHKKSNKDIEDKEEQGHKDVTKVTDKTPTAKDRGGDQLSNGDKAVLKPVKEAYRVYTDSLRQIEESKNTNLGHLAAKHFQHYGNSNPDSGHPNPDRAHQAATQTLHKIKSLHGDKAASAVKQHTDDADNHDNGMAGSGKKTFHKDFVKKHLGGSGSEAHKAYKSHMNKMGYTKKNLGMETHHE
jgi:hypothetical protein